MDDTAGFWLDTPSTYRSHRTPIVQGKQIVKVLKFLPDALRWKSRNFLEPSYFRDQKKHANVQVGVLKIAVTKPITRNSYFTGDY